MTVNIDIPTLFQSWCEQSTVALSQKIPPQKMCFTDNLSDTSPSLFHTTSATPAKGEDSLPMKEVIPSDCLALAKILACHNSSNRWQLLYTLVWRVLFERRDLLGNRADTLVLRLMRMRKQVTRDRHKMTAFVRFSETEKGVLFAYYRPEHYIVELSAEFFKERFGAENWIIATPFRTMQWNTHSLRFSRGLSEDPRCSPGTFEALWSNYYRAIFNPARIKTKAMRNEMPRKYWHTMPETKLIPELLHEAPKRLQSMQSPNIQAARVPHCRSLRELEEGLSRCRACHRCSDRTPPAPLDTTMSQAKIMIVCEQYNPYNETFLCKALNLASIPRSDVYVSAVVKNSVATNAAELFLHRPKGSEINCCKSWLQKEIELLKPTCVVLAGSVAAQALMGRLVSLKDEHLQAYRIAQTTMFISYPLAQIQMQNNMPSSSAARAFVGTLLTVQSLIKNQLEIHSTPTPKKTQLEIAW